MSGIRHRYLSTACLHAVEPGRSLLHEYCKGLSGHSGPKRGGECKFCRALCVCPCHQDPDPRDPHPDCKHEWHGADGGPCPDCGWNVNG